MKRQPFVLFTAAFLLFSATVWAGGRQESVSSTAAAPAAEALRIEF